MTSFITCWTFLLDPFRNVKEQLIRNSIHWAESAGDAGEILCVGSDSGNHRDRRGLPDLNPPIMPVHEAGRETGRFVL